MMKAPEYSVKILDFMKLKLKKDDCVNDIWNTCKDSMMFRSI